MAGPFTHVLVVDAAWMTQGALPAELQAILSKHRQFLFLGSVSPDIPSFHDRVFRGPKWAQFFHKSETSAVPIDALVEIEHKPPRKQIDAARLAWTLGYIGHVVTDATVHPIINEIVKQRDGNKHAHMASEMLQDSLLVLERVGQDILETEMTSQFVVCQEKPAYDRVMDFWKGCIRDQYLPQIYGNPKPDSWVSVYVAGLDAGEPGPDGMGRVVRYLSRHIEGLDRYVYRSARDLRENHKQDVTDFYDRIPLPGGNTGSFLQDGFQRSVDNLLEIWRRLWEADWNWVALSEILQDWNLDTGRTPSGEMTFWS